MCGPGANVAAWRKFAGVRSSARPWLARQRIRRERFQAGCSGTRESSDRKSHDFGYSLPLHTKWKFSSRRGRGMSVRPAGDCQFVPCTLNGRLFRHEFQFVFRVPLSRRLQLVFGLAGVQRLCQLGPIREQGNGAPLHLRESAIDEVLTIPGRRRDQQLSRPKSPHQRRSPGKNPDLAVEEWKAKRLDRLIEERRFRSHQDQSQVLRNCHRRNLCSNRTRLRKPNEWVVSCRGLARARERISRRPSFWLVPPLLPRHPHT